MVMKKKLPKQGFIEKIDVIDLDNNVVGKMTMHEVHEKKLPHRTSHVLIFSTDKTKIFLQKRGPDVFIYPGYFTSNASGHVKSGEDYEKTAYAELKEELGVECELENIGFLWIEEGDNRERNEVYVGYHDGPFMPDGDDVVGGEWFEVAWLEENYKNIKSDPYFRATWECWQKGSKKQEVRSNKQ